MNDVHLHRALSWLNEGESVAVATIVQIDGSSNQPLGSRMYIAAGRGFTGSVSGGCVEEDVASIAETVCSDHIPRRVSYGPVANPVFEVGLNCDGRIWVLIEAVDANLLGLLSRTDPGVLLTLFDPERSRVERFRTNHADSETRQAIREYEELVTRAARDETARSLLTDTGVSVLAEPVLSPPELLIFGATEVASLLAGFARNIGFRVTVTDPRATYANPANHPDADRVIAAWPRAVFDEIPLSNKTYIVSLNHEPRFEDALFWVLAESDRKPAYVGAIGKRTRHHERLERAAAAGLSLERLPRIHTPIGLDTGGKKPAEVALSVAAELLAVRNRRSGGFNVERYRSLGSTEAEFRPALPEF